MKLHRLIVPPGVAAGAAGVAGAGAAGAAAAGASGVAGAGVLLPHPESIPITINPVITVAKNFFILIHLPESENLLFNKLHN